MTARHGDGVAVIGRHPVQSVNASHERSAVGLRRPSAILRQRQYRDRLTGTSKHIDSLVSVFQREIDQRFPGDASSTCHEHPDVPGLVQPVAPAGEPVLVGQVMHRVVGSQLLGSRERPPPARPPEAQRNVTPAQLVEQDLLRLGR